MYVEPEFALDVANILGTTKKISTKDSRSFAKEIAKYIDSKDQKRGKKDKREREKEKEKTTSLMSIVRAKSAQHPRNLDFQRTNAGDDEPALWPLIRQVNVRCKAAALSTGAVLVDLPGAFPPNEYYSSLTRLCQVWLMPMLLATMLQRIT